ISHLVFCTVPTPSFFSLCTSAHRHLHSFPTRRSSDLGKHYRQPDRTCARRQKGPAPQGRRSLRLRPRRRGSRSPCQGRHPVPHPDRKSTRLNSSHVKISYAVFCLKKKKKKTDTTTMNT